MSIILMVRYGLHSVKLCDLYNLKSEKNFAIIFSYIERDLEEKVV